MRLSKILKLKRETHSATIFDNKETFSCHCDECGTYTRHYRDDKTCVLCRGKAELKDLMFKIFNILDDYIDAEGNINSKDNGKITKDILDLLYDWDLLKDIKISYQDILEVRK